MSAPDVPTILAAAGILGGIVRYEMESLRHGRERQEQTKQLQEQTELLRQIREHLISKDALG